MNNVVKNIIFDLCGPILTIDVDLISNKMQSYGTPPKAYNILHKCGLTDKFEAGIITPDEFCSSVRSVLKCNVTDWQIFNAWNTLVTSFAVSHINYLMSIKDKYRLFLLSNSDVVNARFFTDEMNRRAGFDFVDTVFERAYFSHELKMRKPDHRIFQYIIDNHNLNKAETLFVDDNAGHISSASELGLQTCLITDELDITQLDL